MTPSSDHELELKINKTGQGFRLLHCSVVAQKTNLSETRGLHPGAASGPDEGERATGSGWHCGQRVGRLSVPIPECGTAVEPSTRTKPVVDCTPLCSPHTRGDHLLDILSNWELWVKSCCVRLKKKVN